MPTKFLGLFFCLLVAGATSSATKEFRLNVGSARDLSLDEEVEILVSKKGIVDVLSLGNGQWRITALRKGFVIFSWHDDEGDELGRIHIYVDEPLKGFKTTERLSETNYRLSMRVVLLDDSAQRELGVEPILSGRGLKVPISVRDLSLSLRSLQSKRHAKIIGEPSLQLSMGFPGRVKSGGEFQVMYETAKAGEDRKEGWKSTGLEIKTTLLQKNASGMLLSFWLDLKNPKSGGILSDNAIETRLFVPFGEPVMIAASDLSMAMESEEEGFSLAAVPIIGPLFKLVSKENQHTRLFIWLYLVEEDLTSDLNIAWP